MNPQHEYSCRPALEISPLHHTTPFRTTRSKDQRGKSQEFKYDHEHQEDIKAVPLRLSAPPVQGQEMRKGVVTRECGK